MSNEKNKHDRGGWIVMAVISGFFTAVFWKELLFAPPNMGAVNAAATAIVLMPLAVIATCCFVAGLVGAIKPEWFTEPPKAAEDIRDYGNVRYVFGESGSLWKGPCSPDSNLHWAIFEGLDDFGGAIWTLRRSAPPSTDWITAEQVEAAIISKIGDRQ